MSETRLQGLLSKCQYTFSSCDFKSSVERPKLVATRYNLADAADYSKRSFVHVSGIQSGRVIAALTTPVDERLRGLVISDSGMELRVTEGVSDKAAVFLELWLNDEQLVRTVIPSCKDVYFSGSLFGGPVFLSSHACVAFIGEKADPKYPRGFWAENKEGLDAAEKFRLRPDYGEAATKTRDPVLMVYDVVRKSFKTVNLPGYHAAFPTVIPGHPESLLIVGYKRESSLHIPGLSRCFNRPSCLFRVDYLLSDAPVITSLTDGIYTALAPAVSSDGQLVVFPGHADSFSPHCTELDLFCLRQRGGVEKMELQRMRNDESVVPSFNGLCLSSQAESSLISFLPDSHCVVLPSFSSGKAGIFLANLDTSSVVKSLFPPSVKQDPASVTLLNVRGRSLTFVHQGYTSPRSVWLAEIDESLAISYTQIFASPALDATLFANYLGATLSVIQSPDCPAWLLRSALSSPGPKPLITYLHGGPHMMATSSFSIEMANFLAAGYDVVIPNYRGSLSFGKSFLHALEGKSGIVDVADCHACVLHAKQLLNPSTIIAYGGSHGGFLTAWLLGHPDTRATYSAGVLWNPAVDLISSALTSDIPDWALSQVFNNKRCETESVFAPSVEFFDKAFKQSPISVVKHVKVPALVVLGSADKRVVPCGGLRWAQALESNGGKVDVFWYPDQGHAIPGPEFYETAIVTIAKWIDAHVASVTEN